MLKIGVLGVGHLGKIHINCLQQLPENYEIMGFFDPDDEAAAAVQEKFNIPRFDSLEKLLAVVEVVDIVTPTTTHFELAANAIQQGKHLFIEKPLTHTPEEAEKLIELTQRHGVKVQVGHVERFNPALLSLKGLSLNPMFIEAHRLATFNPRGTDVSVVLDLMIHDLDIVLSMVKSEVKHISASGVSVVSHSPDISNARIEFENGCVANITASRMSLKQMRKVRFFQKDAYISLDFLEKKAQIVRLFEKDGKEAIPDVPTLELETATGTKLISIEMPEIQETNAIKMELKSLAESIENDTSPKVPIEDGYRALKVAYDIIKCLDRNNLRTRSK